MKEFLQKFLRIFGLAIYYVLAIILRIPVFMLLTVVVVVALLVIDPIFKTELGNARWVSDLYDWYRGE